jgi:hypothetical protein
MTKRIIHWWNDSSGNYSCHYNDTKGNFQESLIATLTFIEGRGWMGKGEGQLDRQGIRLGPFKSLGQAMKEVEDFFEVVPLDTSM